jgi:hypothetical protein
MTTLWFFDKVGNDTDEGYVAHAELSGPYRTMLSAGSSVVQLIVAVLGVMATDIPVMTGAFVKVVKVSSSEGFVSLGLFEGPLSESFVDPTEKK